MGGQNDHEYQGHPSDPPGSREQAQSGTETDEFAGKDDAGSSGSAESSSGSEEDREVGGVPTGSEEDREVGGVPTGSEGGEGGDEGGQQNDPPTGDVGSGG